MILSGQRLIPKDNLSSSQVLRRCTAGRLAQVTLQLSSVEVHDVLLAHVEN
jgi:hypothetical protein